MPPFPAVPQAFSPAEATANSPSAILPIALVELAAYMPGQCHNGRSRPDDCGADGAVREASATLPYPASGGWILLPLARLRVWR
jgi:hypothetical protein